MKGFLHSLVYLRSDEAVAGIFLAIDGDAVADVVAKADASLHFSSS